jgi:molecular chaperone GrpE
MSESAKAPGRTDLQHERDETKVKLPIADPLSGSGAGVIVEGTAEETPAGESAASTAAAGQDEIEKVRRERDSFYDRLLRQAAEFENYRKRVERERRDQAEYAAADVLRSLLPLVDGMERALAAPAPPGAEPYRKGVEIIHRQMLDLLGRHGVTPVEAVGSRFDPHLHEAVIHEISPDHGDDEVIEELQRGYRLGDRLLRPAMVKVAKA